MPKEIGGPDAQTSGPPLSASACRAVWTKILQLPSLLWLEYSIYALAYFVEKTANELGVYLGLIWGL